MGEGNQCTFAEFQGKNSELYSTCTQRRVTSDPSTHSRDFDIVLTKVGKQLVNII